MASWSNNYTEEPDFELSPGLPGCHLLVLGSCFVFDQSIELLVQGVIVNGPDIPKAVDRKDDVRALLFINHHADLMALF